MTNLPIGSIGGHRGLDVERCLLKTGGTFIAKSPLHQFGNQGKPPPDGLFGVDLREINITAVHNEAAMLCEMSGSGYTPEFLSIESDVLCEEDLGVGAEMPHDGEIWRQNLVRMLATIRARGLRHGDLRGSNIITRGNHPWAIDWQEAHYLGDVPPQKSPFSDSHHVMQHIIGTIGPTGVADVPRVARRWLAVLGTLGASTNLELPLKGQTFLDLGCFQGDFTALAASEGMVATGVDRGGFRTGENSIEIARNLWESFPFGRATFIEGDILDVAYRYDAADVVVMFSTWSYIVQEYGHDRAFDLLRGVIANAGVFFFENQLAGDGPGPEFLRTDADIQSMLHRLGARHVMEIGTFPVTGRPASRTVWRVQR